MTTEIWVAVLALIGTLTGSFGGIMIANKLVNFRLQELERKVEKHNKLVERIIILERDLKTAFREIEETKSDITNLQKTV